MKKRLLQLTRVFLLLFYKKKWISGKWFDHYHSGYKWAIKSIPHRILHYRKPWPYGKNAIIQSGKNLLIAQSSLNCIQGTCYIQNKRYKVTIGNNCYIANNVGLITEQHDVYDLDNHSEGKEITIGDWCWLGMNVVIMPGVVLGDHTVVGANSVVTRSFQGGYVVIAGAPAKVIREIDKDKVAGVCI